MSKTHVAVWLRISPFYDMLLHISNCSEPTSKMLRISEVWRIRQIKFQKQSKKCKHFIPFLKFCLALNSYKSSIILHLSMLRDLLLLYVLLLLSARCIQRSYHHRHVLYTVSWMLFR